MVFTRMQLAMRPAAAAKLYIFGMDFRIPNVSQCARRKRWAYSMRIR